MGGMGKRLRERKGGRKERKTKKERRKQRKK